jgi:hypothetical protein
VTDRYTWRYLYRKSSASEAYPFKPIPNRLTPICKQYRVLDCEDVYDDDDYFKLDILISPDPAYTEYVSPDLKQRIKYQQQAKARALAIVKEIEQYKTNAAWRKRLLHATREFEFVWEPYNQQLTKKYGRYWRQDFLDRVAARAWREQEVERDAERKKSLHEQKMAERQSQMEEIKATMDWVQSFKVPSFTKLISELVDGQPTIMHQVAMCRKIIQAGLAGKFRHVLERLADQPDGFDVTTILQIWNSRQT